MTRRVFVRVRRGPMDNTAVCIYPWEIDILQHIHMQAVTEVSITEMATQKEGVVKVEKLKMKHSKVLPPSLRSQLEMMAYVDPEEDPALDPATEYDRLAGKYGMDKDFPVPVVERIYGQFSSGAFEAKLKQFAEDRQPKPSHMKATDEGLGKSPDQMTVKELRDALTERGVKWKVTEGEAALVEKLEGVLVS